MTFFKFGKAPHWLVSLLLLSAGAAAGFGLGIFCGAEPVVGCRERDLPPLPDEALAALVCTLAARGVGVVGLTAQTKSLEDIFLSLPQTSGEVA